MVRMHFCLLLHYHFVFIFYLINLLVSFILKLILVKFKFFVMFDVLEKFILSIDFLLCSILSGSVQLKFLSDKVLFALLSELVSF